MDPQPFPNGQTLVSSALSPTSIQIIFQKLLLQIFNITVDPRNPDAACRQVRVGWQKEGQPFAKVDEDVCFVMAYVDSDPYGRVRDRLNVVNEDLSVTQTMGYTRVWRMHFTLYGPNSYDRAQLIISAQTLEFVKQYLEFPPESAAQLFSLDFKEPTYGPESIASQWYTRTDLDLRFNEQVNEAVVVPSALSATVEVLEENGYSQSITIPLQ